MQSESFESGTSTLSSATWLSGCWTLSKQQEQASVSWCARLLSQLEGFKRNPNDDFATFWKKPHRKGHDLARVFAVSPVDLYLRTNHRLAGHFARFESDNFCVSHVGVQEFGLVASGTARMGQDEVWWSSPAEVQRMRWESCLDRAYGCTRLERGGDPRTAFWTAVAQNKCQWKTGEGAFLASCR